MQHHVCWFSNTEYAIAEYHSQTNSRILTIVVGVRGITQMPRVAWLRLAALLAAAVATGLRAGAATPAPAIPAQAATAGDARWSLVASSGSDKNGNPHKIAWNAAADESNEELYSVCALDALRVQVEWRLPRNAVHTLLSHSVKKTWRQQKHADGGGDDSWDAHIHSTLELMSVDTNGIVPDTVVASSLLPERSLSNTMADTDAIEVLRKRIEQLRESDKRVLMCDFDKEFCTPSLIGIRLPDIISDHQPFEANHTIVLEFAQPTNRPVAFTKQDIDRYVRFTEYLGDEMTGVWSADGRVLEIKVLAVDSEKLKPIQELMQGLLQTTLQPSSSLDSGNPEQEGEPDEAGITTAAVTDQGRFRIEPLGLYRVRLVISDSELGQELFAHESPVFRVVQCEDEATTVLLRSSLVAIASSHSHSEKQDDQPLVVKPSFSLDGVITLAGQEGFVLPHSAIHMQEFGSWSLSFWKFSTQDATGGFRSLFFNGDGTKDMRTPSAWWKPDENKLVLRASTNVSLDVGMDSEQLISQNLWVHLGFSFRNCSSTAGDGDNTANISESTHCVDSSRSERPWFYAISFFVNGVIDKEVFFYAPAIANNGPLHVGKGPWTDGMRGFMSNLKVFPEPISDAQHRETYLKEQDAHLNFPSDFLSEDVHDEDGAVQLEGGPQGAKAIDWSRPALQISYLLQRRISASSSSSGSTELVVTDSDTATASNLKSLQDQTYRQAQQVLESCDRSGWDILVEAAELGHPEALRDVGKAHLYGFYDLPDSCAEAFSLSDEGAASPSSLSIPVKQDFSLARDQLEAALDVGAWDSSKFLVLLFASSRAGQEDEDTSVGRNPPLANLTMGLYHLAAMAGRKDAFVVLARRYTLGDGIPLASRDIGVYHYYHAAIDASAAYHERGKQPLHEMNRLYDGLKVDLTKGQLGDDDELIQFQKLRAEQGDVNAMAAMGDLYYWGARGMPRDHVQAHKYFSRAADAGHVSSQSALAGMLLKGEGAPQNNESAIVWYEKAAKHNHTRALNGLGFIHFHGSGGVAENKTLALEFFERSAANEEDGDSVFNAGYCHALGLGTVVNFTRAMHFYEIAARKFGHFDAIFEMGKIWMVGIDSVVERNMELANMYLKAASDAGRWGKCVRKAFDLYLAGDFQRAAVLYHEAQEYGYPVATSNLAFLYDQRLLKSGDVMSETRAFTFLMQTSLQNGDKEVLVRIGDYHFYGLAGLQSNAQEAVRWYSRASAEGVDAGAYSVGHMHEYGIGVAVNLDRAERYYSRVLELASGSSEVTIVVRIALARLAFRKWLQHTPFGDFVTAPGQPSYQNGSNATTRLQFSELGGVGLEKFWESGWISLTTLSPFLLAIGLAVCGFLYVRRSA